MKSGQSCHLDARAAGIYNGFVILFKQVYLCKAISKPSGRLIASQVAPHPRRRRRMLSGGYSWVSLCRKRKKLTDAKSAYARMNGRVADTLIRGMNQPQQAVMVNIFMPCELMHAMGLTPMFPEGLSVYVACTACQHVFAERAETSGIPESFCSYHKTMIGMAESGRAAQTAADCRNDAGL